MVRLRSSASPLALVLITVLVAASLVFLATDSAEACSAVFRFYNPSAGTHFYTTSDAEANTVMTKWANVYTYEGVAYTANVLTNTAPLYRFYNKANGSHFYTASEAEKASVMANLSGVLAYEGEAFKVAPAEVPGGTTVYRFYNRARNSHFYTASIEERDLVQARWGSTYAYEGVGYYLAP